MGEFSRGSGMGRVGWSEMVPLAGFYFSLIFMFYILQPDIDCHVILTSY